MNHTSFYSEQELRILGLKQYGENVLISRKCSIYTPNDIIIGNNVRIDDFCILSGKITLNNNIHIAPYCALYGACEIEFEDYAGTSARCTIYSAVDDFSGNYLVGPICPEKYRHIIGGKVTFKKFSQIGANCVILPNVTIGEGCAVGALSFVNKSLDDWGIYCGIPAKRKSERNKNLLKFIY